MRMISLNVYSGVVYEPLMEFLRKEKEITDIFSFQEVLSAPEETHKLGKRGRRMNLLQEISRELSDFSVYFVPMDKNLDTDPNEDGESLFGIATFVKKSHEILLKKDTVISVEDYAHSVPVKQVPCVALRVDARVEGQLYTVVNLHGMAWPGHKRDTEERIAQSQKVLDLILDASGKRVIAGDFNLYPDTESIHLIERAGYENLIVSNKITTTRGSLLRVLFPEFANGEYGYQEFADYTFVSPDITVREFSVPDVPISDHLPMILTCE